MLNFKLFENIQQAKSFLQKKKIKDMTDFDEISELLSKNPNYIFQFTKFRYQDKIDMEDIKKVIDTIKNKKEIISLLKRNLIDYTNFEELIDDITKASYKSIVNKFLTDVIWYKKYRSELKKYLSENPQKENIVLDFLKLDTTLQKQFLSTLKYYELNNVSPDFFMDEMENFIENKSLRSSEIIDKLKKYSNQLNIVYNNENIIIITTRNRTVVKEFGSQKWCIVYNDNFFDSYIGNKATQQYICFNLNIPQSDYNSLFGITVNPDGTIPYGARQDSDNNTKDIGYIVKSLSVGADIFKPLTNDELSKIDPICLINSNIIGKLTKNQISKLDIDTKLQYKLLEESEIKTLPAIKKVKNGYISYLTESDISELPEDMIERYDIVLSDEEMKKRDAGFKLRNSRFNYLTESDINDINQILKRKFNNIQEIEDFYKNLNLIEKIEIMLGVDRYMNSFELFFSKTDFLPLVDKWEVELLEEDLGDLISGKSIDLFETDQIDILNGDFPYSFNMNNDNISNLIDGYFNIVLDKDELNYIGYYINDENESLLKEEYDLTPDDVVDVIGGNFFVRNFLQDDTDILGNLGYDMERVGNEESNKFNQLSPVVVNKILSINFDRLLDYLLKNELTNFKTLTDWTSLDVLFIDNEIDYSVLQDFQPSVNKNQATEFNDQLTIYLDDYEGDRTLLRKLIDLGFKKGEWNQGLVLYKNDKSVDIFDITDKINYNFDGETFESDIESFIQFVEEL